MAKITDQDIQAIQGTIGPWTQACLDRDWDALFDLCTPDITFLPPDEPVQEGSTAVRSYMDDFPVMKAFTFNFTRIDGREDLATARGNFTITAEIEGEDVTMNGKFIDTFRKTDSGDWLYDEVIWSNNEPMA